MSDEQTRERARTNLEDAVYQMLEAGFKPAEITEEVEYALASA